MLSVASVMIYNIFPLYLGAAADDLGLNPDQIGFLAGAEVGALALAAIFAPLWINRLNWRVTVITATIIIVVGDLATTQIETYTHLLVARFVTGFFGEGVAYALGLALVGELREPDRVFGFVIFTQVVIGAIGLFLLPPLIASFGLDAPLIALAGLALLVLPVLRWFPIASRKHELAMSSPVSFPVYLVFLGLIVHAIWYLNVGGFWAFIERMGIAAGLATQDVGTALAIGMVLGAAGALIAGILGDRFGRLWPFCTTLSVQAALMIFMANTTLTAAILIVVMTLYNFAWNFGLPYLLGLIATADSRGQFLVLTPAFQSIGTGGGPAVAGLLVVQSGFAAINIFAAVCCVVSLLLFVPFALRVSRYSASASSGTDAFN